MSDSSKEEREEKKNFPKKRSFRPRKENQDRPKNHSYKKNNRFQKKERFESTENKEGNRKSYDNKKPFPKKNNFRKRNIREGEAQKESYGNREKRNDFRKKKFFDKNKRSFDKGNQEDKKEKTTQKHSQDFRRKRNNNFLDKRVKEQKQIDRKYRRPSESKIKQIDEKKYRNQKQKKVQKEKETIRLNKYIANAGVCSRREADTLISQGKITVNNKVVTEMGFQVKKDDIIKYGKTILRKESLVYVLLNKPKDYITTTDDPQERKTVMDLVSEACKERIYPVGRLDRNTTGLLFFTNDGDLAKKLSHPSGNISKIYEVGLDKPLTENDLQQIEQGLILEDGFVQVDDLAVISPDNMTVGLELHSGKNRIVRRIFEHLGYEVLKLDRTTYAGLNKKDLPRGNWRFLSEKEIMRLKYFI